MTELVGEVIQLDVPTQAERERVQMPPGGALVTNARNRHRPRGLSCVADELVDASEYCDDIPGRLARLRFRILELSPKLARSDPVPLH